MRERNRNVLSSLLLIAVAVLLVIWKMELIYVPSFIRGVSAWTLVLAMLMLFVMVRSIVDLSFGGIFFPAAILCILFDKPLGITALTPWTVLVVALLLTIAFDRLFPRWSFSGHVFPGRGGMFTSESSEDEKGMIYHRLKFGSATQYVNSDCLRQVQLQSQFGELSVIFDHVIVEGDTVRIYCQASFGEMHVYVPREWEIINHIRSSFGECKVEYDREVVPENGIRCEFIGSVSFGTLKIHRV